MNTTYKVRDFTMHGSTGISVLHSDWITWVTEHQGMPGFSSENGYGLGEITHHSWCVGDARIEVPNSEWIYSYVLPDNSGFVGFEKELKADNCLLLDAYGKKRTRLTVPWEIVGYEGIPTEMRKHSKPKPRKMWFRDVSAPYTHPTTGEPGKFGVTANLEYGDGAYDYCDYYFELDWCAGKFLWGAAIRY